MYLQTQPINILDSQKVGFFWYSYFNAQKNIKNIGTIWWNMRTGKSSFSIIFPIKLSTSIKISFFKTSLDVSLRLSFLKLQVWNLPVTYWCHFGCFLWNVPGYFSEPLISITYLDGWFCSKCSKLNVLKLLRKCWKVLWKTSFLEV